MAKSSGMKEWIMLLIVVSVTLALSMGAIRYLMPQLFGIPTDLKIVKVDERVVPFYEAVFASELAGETESLLLDPYTKTRALPLMVSRGELGGPNDLLGFRNVAVPNYADVLVLGDSHTYGNNAIMMENWPHQMQSQLLGRAAQVYSMATGGWGAVQYLDMFMKGSALRPRVAVVAFYSGNDALESYWVAYGIDHWRSLRVLDDIGDDDLPPPVEFPPPPDSRWLVTWPDGESTEFTAGLRLRSNETRYKAVRAGWAVMARVAEWIDKIAAQSGVKLVFTVIPTKELVFAPRLQTQGIALPSDYAELVRLEQQNIDELGRRLSALPGKPVVVDVVTPLQQAVLHDHRLYPPNDNGHPMSSGYAVIADTLGVAVRKLLPAAAHGLVRFRIGDNDTYLFALDGDVWQFPSVESVLAHGWSLEDATPIDARMLIALLRHGLIAEVDRRRFGPPALRAAGRGNTP